MGFGQKALSIGEPDAFTHALLGSANLRLEKYDRAIGELHRAIELNPNDALSHLQLGTTMLYMGRTHEAIQLLKTGLRFDPYAKLQHDWNLALAYYLEGNYDDAIITLEQGLMHDPDSPWKYIALTAAYAQAGRREDAQRAAEKVKKLHPFFELESSYNLFRNPEDRKKFHDGLRKAGFG